MSDTSRATAHRQANGTCLENLFAALGRQDLAAAGRCCHPDFRIEPPCADPPARIHGFANHQAYVSAAFETFTFELSIEELHDRVDPALPIVESTALGRATPMGNRAANRYIGLWRFAGGRIQAGRECYNPDAARRAAGRRAGRPIPLPPRLREGPTQ